MKTLLLLVFFIYPINAVCDWHMEVDFVPTDINSGSGVFKGRVVAWDTQDNTPNPLYGCKAGYCRMLLGLDGAWYDRSSFGFAEVSTSKTMGELGANFIRNGFIGRELTTLDSNRRPKCIMFGYLMEGTVSYHFVPLPGGMQCIPPAIVPTACDIREPQLELRYGTLADGVINGRTASTTLTVVCNFDFNVRIMSADRTGSIYFNADRQFRSDLTINGVNLGEGVLVSAKPTGVSLTLTSTLNGYDGSLGAFQGSKTIIVSLP